MATESAHWLIIGKMISPPFLGCFFIWFFLYLQVTRTCIKSRRSLTFSQIGPLTRELATLERLKISHRLIMGKWCLQASSFIFDQIFVKLAGNQDSHKISDEFEFRLDRMSHFGVTCPCGRIKFSIDILWCLHLFSVVFDPILFILAGNEDMHKISNQFDFRPDWTTDYRVSCPWASKNFP